MTMLETFAKSKIICVDIETKDPELTKKGPGVYRKDGYVVGVGLACEGAAVYCNIAHPDGSEGEKQKNRDFIREVLALPVPKIGANFLYDLDWLENYEDIPVNGKLYDIQIAEPLIDPYARSYSLAALARKYLGEGKKTNALELWCAENMLPVSRTKPVQSYIYKMPSWVVTDYVMADIKQPLEIFRKQYGILQVRKMIDVFNMECELLRPLLLMRKNGVRIDLDYVKNQQKWLEEQIHEDKKTLFYDDLGYTINVNATAALVKVCKNLGITTGKTDKGNDSVGKGILEHSDNPVLQKIGRIRRFEKVLNTFFEGSFNSLHIGGRIHGQFYPLKSERGGTVTGRFSSASPNLQNIPARDPITGPMCRRAFIPEDGMLWGKMDLSQIQYRAIAHYAMGPKSDYIRQRYNDNPGTDYHKEIMELSGIKERKLAKNLNFGLAFNMGVDTAADYFGWDLAFAQSLFSMYHKNVPFVRYTSKVVEKAALSRGYITSVLGRRLFPRDKNSGYKLYNYLMQATEADVMKASLVAAFEGGIFSELVLHLTVHDEYDFSIPRTSAGFEAVRELQYIMENTVKLNVPIKADCEVGKNWHDIEDLTDARIQEYINGK